MEKSGIFIALVMGAIQGIFEWLPVSSHLVINNTISLFGESFQNNDFDSGYGFWLHLGTMISILIVLRNDLTTSFKKISIDSDKITINFYKLITIATVVSLFFGMIFFLISDLKIINLLGIFVMGTMGGLLISESTTKNQDFRKISDFNFLDSLLIGLVQGLAVIPGVSRSGVAIGVLVKRKLNIHSSFLLNCYLNIPLSLASSIYMILSARTVISYYSIISLFASFAVGSIFLFLILKVFEKFEQRKLLLFTSLLILGSCFFQVFFKHILSF